MGINTWYILLAAVFLAIITSMVVYSVRLKSQKRTKEVLGRPPVSMEEGILIATEDKEKVRDTTH
ncbi:MAG: hypothetical protein ABI142_14255 [Bryocella sp.]